MAIEDIVGFRHGRTPGNADNILQGCSIDHDLDAVGRNEVAGLARLIATICGQYDGVHLVTSDLKRAVSTMDTVRAQIPGNLVRSYQAHPALRERNYGSFEGKQKEKVREAPGHQTYWQLATVAERQRVKLADDVETDIQIVLRVRNLVNQIIVDRKDTIGKELLVISTHGNTLRTVLSAIFNDPNYPPFKNAEHILFSVADWNQMIVTNN